MSNVNGAARGVVITGAGAICSLGDTRAAIHAALCDGRAGFGAPTVFGADLSCGYNVAEVHDFTPQTYLGERNLRPLDRTGRLAAVAAELALADSGWSVDRRREHELGVILGTMFCSVRTIGEFDRRGQQAGPEYASPLDFSNTVLNAAAGQIAIWHNLRGVNSTISTGAASGLHAIGYGAQLIRAGRAAALMAGGAEELCFESFYGFLRANLLSRRDADRPGCAVPFDARRSGCALGEGAAFVVLESEDTAANRGARVIGRIDGFAAAYDPRQDVDERREPYALVHAITGALAGAGVSGSSVAAVSASANGSPMQDAREASAIRAAIGSRTAVTAVKSGVGETLGASGALQVMMMLESLQTGRLPAIVGLEDPDPAIDLDLVAVHPRPIHASRALVTASAVEGNCCALVVSVG
jgi:3-oxoacyl-[acyl-carrier-protein] synthase II